MRAEIAAGRHLSTLAAFGSSGAVSAHGDVVRVRARKSWVIAAGEADSYVWACGSGLWLVPAQAPGLLVPDDHAGMGLRGTVATCVEADPVRVPASNRLWHPEQADDRVRLLAVTATEAAVAVTDLAMKVCG
ncbi:MAG TPA: hypothetical protein VM306_37060, partial [Lentzea sp.]|nr:hypothetical protein [Lentzea sp.]